MFETTRFTSAVIQFSVLKYEIQILERNEIKLKELLSNAIYSNEKKCPPVLKM